MCDRYKGRVRYYEIINEPDLSVRDVEAYLKLVKAGSRGIKRADPTAVVLASGVSGVDFDRGRVPFTTKFLELGGHRHCGLIPFHPYAYPRTFSRGYTEGPEANKQAEKQRWVRDLCRKHGLRMWIGELGWSMSGEGRGGSDERFLYPGEEFPSEERHFASYLARTMLIAKMEPTLEAHFWFVASFDNTFYNWKGTCNGYSLCGRGDNILASAAAYASLASLTEGFAFSRRLTLNDKKLWAPVFARKDRSILALWAAHDAFLLPGSLLGNGVRTLDILGNEKGLVRGGIRIDGEPTYILGPGRAIAALSAKLEKTRLGFFEDILVTDAFLTPEHDVVIVLKNRNREQVSPRIELAYPGGTDTLRVKLGSLDEKIVRVRLKKAPKKGSRLPVEVRLTRAGHTSERHFVLSPPPEHTLVATRATGKITVDGSLADWPRERPIYLNRRDQVLPPDPGVWGGTGDLSGVGYLMHDDECLYFACAVKDDVHLNNQPGHRLWAQDSIQLATGSAYEKRYAEITFALTPRGIKNQTSLGRHSGKPAEGLRIAVKQLPDGGGLVYETAIPWQALEPVKLLPGKVVHFAFIINDDDGRGRKWMGIANPAAIGATKDLKLYPRLLLQARKGN